MLLLSLIHIFYPPTKKIVERMETDEHEWLSVLVLGEAYEGQVHPGGLRS